MFYHHLKLHKNFHISSPRKFNQKYTLQNVYQEISGKQSTAIFGTHKKTWSEGKTFFREMKKLNFKFFRKLVTQKFNNKKIEEKIEKFPFLLSHGRNRRREMGNAFPQIELIRGRSRWKSYTVHRFKWWNLLSFRCFNFLEKNFYFFLLWILSRFTIWRIIWV